MTTSETTNGAPPASNIALMTAAELEGHIEDMEVVHKTRMRTLRALQRARLAEEASK